MKEIRIKFIDYWDNHHMKDDIIYKILCKHYKVVLDEKPDYLFCSVFSDEHLNYNCIKIFYTAENIVPDFNLYDYAIGFEFLSLGDRYIRFPNYLKYKNEIEYILDKKYEIKFEDAVNRKFCSFVYSNSNSHEMRKIIFENLSKYKFVESGGSYLNNIGFYIKDKLDFEKGHKFSVACENCDHEGYSTEKIIQSFAADTVPIYWGDNKINEIFNDKAFININQFQTIEEFILKIEELDNNDELYYNMLLQPKFIDSSYVNIKYNELEKFLINIFNQPYENAFRRTRIVAGLDYFNKLKKWKFAYFYMENLKKNRRIVFKILNYFFKYEGNTPI